MLSNNMSSNSENFEKLAKASKKVGEAIAEAGLINSGQGIAEQLQKLTNDDYVVSQGIIQYISNSIKTFSSQEVSKGIREMSKILSQAFKENVNNFAWLSYTIKKAYAEKNDLLEKITNNAESIFHIHQVKLKIFAEQEIIVEKLELCINFPNKIISNSDINKAAFCTELNAIVQGALRVDNELNTELNNYIGLDSLLQEIDL